MHLGMAPPVERTHQMADGRACLEASNFRKRGCNIVHANLISRNFKIHSGRFCRIIEDPSTIGVVVIKAISGISP